MMLVILFAGWRWFGGSCSNLQAAAEGCWLCWRQEADRSQVMSGRYVTLPESLDKLLLTPPSADYLTKCTNNSFEVHVYMYMVVEGLCV